MTGSRSAEVIVVGAGPAGAALSARLAGNGHDVLLLDQASFPRDKACGEFLSPGVVDALDRLGALDAVLLNDHCRHPAMTIVAGADRHPLRYEDPRQALGVRRHDLDHALVTHAQAQGVEFRQHARVTGVVLDGGRVAGVRLRGGEELRAEVVAAADGLHSTIARALGLERPVRWPRRLGLIAHYELPEASSRPAEMHVGDGLYCGLNPVGDRLVNVGLVTRIGAKHEGEPVAEYFERRLNELPGVVAALRGGRRVSSIRGMGPLARRVRRVAAPGLILVGDAAGFFDPFTGEGIHRALIGAELGAVGIERALQRPDRFPVGYAEARRQAFANKERLCLLIQLFLQSPRTLDYALGRLNRRPEHAAALAGSLGDYLPADHFLRPRRLAALLAP